MPFDKVLNLNVCNYSTAPNSPITLAGFIIGPINTNFGSYPNGLLIQMISCNISCNNSINFNLFVRTTNASSSETVLGGTTGNLCWPLFCSGGASGAYVYKSNDNRFKRVTLPVTADNIVITITPDSTATQESISSIGGAMLIRLVGF